MTDFDRAIGRLLIALTYVGTALLVVGVLLMVANGIPPLSGGPSLISHRSRVTSSPSGRPVSVAGPLGRARDADRPSHRRRSGIALAGDRQMVVVAVATLVVIGVAIGSAVAFG